MNVFMYNIASTDIIWRHNNVPEPSWHGVIVLKGMSEATGPWLRDTEDTVQSECRRMSMVDFVDDMI
eukprot:scaffold55159_cov58-Cyclotella_meneghiniana.AAC.10